MNSLDRPGAAARGPTTQSEEGPAEPRPPLGLGAPETGGALSSPASSREREIAARGREPWRASWTLNPRGQEETPPYGENAKPDAAPQRRGWLMEAGGDEGVGEAAPRSWGITETAEGRSRGLTASGTIRLPHWGPRLTAPRPPPQSQRRAPPRAAFSGFSGAPKGVVLQTHLLPSRGRPEQTSFSGEEGSLRTPS